jgi:hypothetical protein
MTLEGHQSDKLTDEEYSHQSILNCRQSTPKLTVAEAAFDMMLSRFRSNVALFASAILLLAILSICWIQTTSKYAVSVPPPTMPLAPEAVGDDTTQDNPRWSWNPDKDRNNHRLSEA